MSRRALQLCTLSIPALLTLHSVSEHERSADYDSQARWSFPCSYSPYWPPEPLPWMQSRFGLPTAARAFILVRCRRRRTEMPISFGNGGWRWTVVCNGRRRQQVSISIRQRGLRYYPTGRLDTSWVRGSNTMSPFQDPVSHPEPSGGGHRTSDANQRGNS